MFVPLGAATCTAHLCPCTCCQTVRPHSRASSANNGSSSSRATRTRHTRCSPTNHSFSRRGASGASSTVSGYVSTNSGVDGSASPTAVTQSATIWSAAVSPAQTTPAIPYQRDQHEDHPARSANVTVPSRGQVRMRRARWWCALRLAVHATGTYYWLVGQNASPGRAVLGDQTHSQNRAASTRTETDEETTRVHKLPFAAWAIAAGLSLTACQIGDDGTGQPTSASTASSPDSGRKAAWYGVAVPALRAGKSVPVRRDGPRSTCELVEATGRLR